MCCCCGVQCLGNQNWLVFNSSSTIGLVTMHWSPLWCSRSYVVVRARWTRPIFYTIRFFCSLHLAFDERTLIIASVQKVLVELRQQIKIQITFKSSGSFRFTILIDSKVVCHLNNMQRREWKSEQKRNAIGNLLWMKSQYFYQYYV